LAMFEVTTVNRLAARRLLTKCGVRPEMARTMSLKQLTEHLTNFVELSTISADTVKSELATQQGDGVPHNAGQSWTTAMDQELMEHFRRGMDLQTMARIRGRTRGGIEARLQKLGLMEYDRYSGRSVLTALGKQLQNDAQGEHDEDDNKHGEFMTPEELAKLDAQVKAESGIKIAPKLEDGTPVDNAAIAAMIAAALNPVKKDVSTLSGKYAELQQTIADTIAAEVKKAQGAWQKFEIVTQDRVHKIEGLAHKAFPRLLRAVSARTRHDKGALNIWLYGPAGTGKSTAARKLAEAFSLDFHTNGPVGSQWDIRGFTDAQGKVVETAFRKAWINGGVYCWDEGDGSAPAALIEANGALATGFASFPDGVHQRHPDCIVIINGNLRPGAAPDATYNGRYKQDTAFVNRFVAIEWGIDEDLERALLGKLDSIGEQWLKFVKSLRRKITERGIKGIVVSPRQTQYGLALLDAGAELDEVMDQVVKFMFTDDQWSQISK
jgi:cobaltochelatase CobS